MLLSIICCTTEVLNTDLMSVIRLSVLEKRDGLIVDNCFLITMQFSFISSSMTPTHT